jgi:hypothetical protein
VAEVELVENFNSDWRGGTKPGRPKKGEETKKRFAETRNEVYREIDKQTRESDLDLFNAADPSVPIIKEKFEHRGIAYMRASGLTRKNIFERLGGRFNQDGKPISGSGQYSYCHLGNILNQPWFRKRVVELQHEAGFEGVEASIRAELPSAVETVVEIMNDEKASHTARLNAAAQVLDRGLGKAVQKVESKNLHAHQHVHEDANVLMKELRAVEQELKQQGASVTAG